MPSEFFTVAPHWEWWVVVYFFVGGIAGGAYFLGAMMDIFGGREDHSLARLGYLVAFPGITVGGLLLIVDLTRKERFWHMLVQNHTYWPSFKWYSPISLGSWGLTVFGGFAFLTFLAALVPSTDAPRSGPLRPLHRLIFGGGLLGKLFLGVGALLGLFVAGYTGVLLAATNRPIWGNTSFTGMLFLVSGVSTAAATLLLLSWGRRSINRESVHALTRFDDWALIIELVVLILLVVSVYPVLAAASTSWLATWGLVLIAGVILLGILLPLALQLRPRGNSLLLAATMVLVGGFLLRVLLVMSSETIVRNAL